MTSPHENDLTQTETMERSNKRRRKFPIRNGTMVTRRDTTARLALAISNLARFRGT